MTRKRVLLCSLLLSLLYVIPIAFFNKGLNGADLSFHLNRLLGMEGIYASPINFKAFYGIGLGVNYFYPFLTYYPFFVLYRLSHSVFLGYYIYQYLLTIITFLIAYYSVSNIMVIENKENKKDFAGLLFATLYTFSLYRLDNIVIRFAMGEFIAYAFIPLVFYGLFVILKGDYKKWYVLSIGMSLIAYSHLISLLLTGLLVGLIFIITFGFVDSKKERLLSFIVATLSTISIFAFQLVLMGEQSLSNAIVKPVGISLNTTTHSLKDLLLNPNFDNNYTLPGFLIIVCLLVSLIGVFRLQKYDVLIFVLTFLLIILESPLIHWPENSEHVVSSIQFIWRLNNFITLFTAYLASKVFVSFILRKEYLIAVLIGVISLTTFFTVSQARKTVEGPQTTFNNMPKEELLPLVTNGDYHATDYMLKTDGSIPDYDAFQRKLRHEVINLQNNQVVKAKMSVSSLKTNFEIISDKNITVSLPVYAYKGVAVDIDGHRTDASKSPDAGVKIVVPEGKHEIEVSYHYTIWAKIFFAISLVSGILVAFYGYIVHKKQ
ncbi:MAG: hypothetical protein ACTH8N_01500 [Streptococcus thermophilus]|uniref:Membrane protein 6-pyruvoyl-tetrahydropterin synthase-related domain-containing protein n=1 Tax=Streptococcus thermophilus TaxID=1308 RepID=A0A4Y5FRL1_STRTR|nr:hypothetical protein [Streptococcus thermophilus]MCE2272725.1 hypothetical protein [Streptococcus thermophilus]MCT2962277.1 hypothetical protein [Streptococcus thermophilus]MDA5503339.1 hypothetical protein [Streptococcus thermophilus]MEE1510828.1 hypothetical protein [Streptococcus thermophilus]NVH34447.1 hypothetical protein [Streptococcus thermophilus]